MFSKKCSYCEKVFYALKVDMNISTIAKKLKRTTLSIRKKILNLKKAKYENTNK